MKSIKTYWIQALLVILGSIYFFQNSSGKSRRPKWNYKKGYSYLYDYSSQGIATTSLSNTEISVTMKADLVRFIKEKKSNSWIEELYFKNISFAQSSVDLDQWKASLANGVTVERSKEGEVISWAMHEASKDNPFWKRIVQQFTVAIPSDNSLSWSIKDNIKNSFYTEYSVEQQTKRSFEIKKKNDYYEKGAHFSSKATVELKTFSTEIFSLSIHDMSEKNIMNKQILSNTTTDINYISYDTRKVEKDKFTSVPKITNPKKRSTNSSQDIKKLLDDNLFNELNTKAFVKFKSILKDNIGSIQEIEDYYLALDIDTNEFKFFSKALMGSGNKDLTNLLLKALNKNISNTKKASYLIGSVALAKTPTIECSRTLEQIAESQPELYSQASLALGVLANKFKATNSYESINIFEKRIKNIKDFKSQKKIITELSAIGNMGLDDSQEFLENYLSKLKDESLQVATLKAMRKNSSKRVNKLYLHQLKDENSNTLKQSVSFYLNY